MGISFFCINNSMGRLLDDKKNIVSLSPNIIMHLDKGNLGELYVYDKKSTAYVLNGITASDLVDYFALTDNADLSEEIIDVCMNIIINTGTH